MTANTSRRFRTAFMIMMVCIPVAFAYEFISDGRITVVRIVIGIALAMPLALLEESTFDERMRHLPFSGAILAKSLTHIGSLFAVFISASLVFGLLQRLAMEDFWASFAEPDYYLQVGVSFGLCMIIVFFRQLDRLLGPGVLLSYLLGRYHRPPIAFGPA